MKRIIKSFSTYTLVSVFGSAAGFVLMPVLTHHLTKEDYGTLALFNTYVQLTIPVISLSAFGLVSLEYFNKENSKIEFKSIFSSISLIPVAGFICFYIISLAFKESLSSLLNVPGDSVAFISCFALLSVLFQQFQSYVVIEKRTLLYTLLNIGKTILEYSLVLVMVILLARGWFGRVEAALMVLFLMCLLSFWFYAKWGLLTIRIKWSHIKAGIIYGSPLIAHVVGRFVMNQSDKIFISKLVSNSELGVYNTGYLLGSIIMILSGAFVNTYTPFLYERLSDATEYKKIEIVRLSYLFILVLIVATIGVSIIAPYFFSWFIDKRYASGVQYVFWVSLGYLFWGCYLIFAGYLFYFKKTKVLASFSLINVLLNLTLNYFLIRAFGALGAAYATTISFFVVFILVMFASHRTFAMPWFSLKDIIYGLSR